MSHIEEGRLHAYVDDQLPEQERSEIETHVAECAQCRARLDAAEELVRASRAILGQVDPGPGQPAPWPEIEARGAARSHGPRRGVWLDPRLAWAATIALAFAVGWLARDVQAPGGVGDVSWTQPLVRERTDSIEAFVDEPTLASKETEPPGAAEAQPERPATPSEVAKTETPPSQPELAEREQDRDDAAQAPSPPAESKARRRADAEAPRPAEEEARRRADVARRDEGERAYAAPMALGRQTDSLALGAGVALDEITVHALRVEGATIAEDAGFLGIEPSAAATWLGAPSRTLPGLALERAEVGPGSAVRGGVEGLPAVRLVYRDDAGRTVTLLQQHVEVDTDTPDTIPTLLVPPSGPNAYRWTDGAYLLTLSAELGADSLRALAARVR